MNCKNSPKTTVDLENNNDYQFERLSWQNTGTKPVLLSLSLQNGAVAGTILLTGSNE